MKQKRHQKQKTFAEIGDQIFENKMHMHMHTTNTYVH